MKNTSQVSSIILQIFLMIIFFTFFIVFIFFPELVKTVFAGLKDLSTQIGVYNIPLIALIAAIESFPGIGVIVPGQQLLLVV